MTDMQRREDCYQVPARVLDEMIEAAVQRAMEQLTPKIIEEAAKAGVTLAIDNMKKDIGTGVLALAKYVGLSAILALLGWLAWLGKIKG